MAIEKIIDIKIQGNVDEAVGSLRSQLKQAQAEVSTLSEKFGDTSDQAVQAAEKAAILADKIGDAKSLTEAFNPDAKFKALTSSLAGVASGFGAVQSTMALFGQESEGVEKTLLKVQSAMQLTQFLQQSGESIDSFKQLGAVVKSYSIVQKASTAAQWLWNAAQAASPIGAIIVAITALIAAGVALVNYFKTSSEEAKNNSKAVNENAKALANETKALERGSKEFDKRQKHQVEMAKASGKSAEAIRQLELKLADEKIAFEKSARAAAFNTYEKNKNYLATLKLADADEEVIKKQQETVNKSIESYNKQNQAVQASFDEKKSIQLRHQVEITQANTNHSEEVRKKQKEAAQKAAEDLKAERKKDLEDLKTALQAQKDARQNNINEVSDAISEAQDKQNEFLGTAQEAEEQKVKDKYFRLLELAKQQARSKEEIDVLEVQRENELNDIRLAAQEKKYQQDEEAAKKQIEIEKSLADAKNAIQNQQLDNVVGGIGVLKGVFEKNKAIQKGLLVAENAAGIAKIIINTMAGNAKTIATMGVLPAAPFVAANNIGAGISIAASIAATAKGLAALGGGGGGGSAPSLAGASGGGATAPSFNVVGNAGTNQLAQSMAGQNAQPVQAYVVSGAVTTAQSLDRNIVSNATIG